MRIEQEYLEALQLTEQMRDAATSLDWDRLAELEKRRSGLINAIPSIASIRPALDLNLARRIAQIITEMERIGDDITEQLAASQEHIRTLLQFAK